MKKIIITTVALSVVATSGFSQGLINLSGGASAATKMSTNSVVGGPATGVTAAGAGLYYYALFASSSQNSINGSSSAVSGLSGNYVFNNTGGGSASTGWVLVGMATNTLATGRYVAASQGTTSFGQGALNADGSMTVQGIAGAGAASIVTVGWSGAIGSTLSALSTWYSAGASSGWIGQSGIASVTLGDGSGIATPNPFGTTAGQVGGIMMGLTPIVPVPEPTTLALAGLSGASLLLFRRRK